MKYLIPLTTLLLSPLAACGQPQQPASEADADSAPENAQSAEIYSGLGRITAIAGDQVTIEHGPIEGIGWPAMTMAFTAPAGVVEGAEAGSDVAFAFKQQGSAYVLTSIEKR